MFIKYDETNRFTQLCWQNAAICNNKLGGEDNYRNAVDYCTKALLLNDKSEKALANRATAFMNLKIYARAHADCKEAIKLNPNNKAYREMFEKI